MLAKRLGQYCTALVLAWGVASSCESAADIEVITLDETGFVFGQAFLDLNGNRQIDAGDAALKNAGILLTATGSPTVLDQTTTDSLGLFFIGNLPAGVYALSLDSAVLGDSLGKFTTSTATLGVGDTLRVDVGATYPELSLADVRTAAPGQRVFTKGIALNPRQSFSDGTVHFQEGVTYLRATNVAPSGIAIGDSVRLLGRTAVDQGQPTLDGVTPLLLRSLVVIPLPQEVTTGVASTGGGGPLDAALVRIRNAEISDTSTAPNGDFHYWAYNGGDSIEVVYKWFLQISTAGIRPDTIVRLREATGLLAPFDDGSGVRWRLIPRAASGIVVETKFVDVAIGTAFDTPATTTGQTVEIRVTAANSGPHTATNVRVSNPIPAGLLFLSATATAGTFDDASGIWSVGDLPLSASDTLTIQAEVTSGPGTVTNVSQLLTLTREVETNGGNNGAMASLTVS